MSVRWTPAARRDITDLYDYIVLAGSPLEALNFAAAIEDFAETFASMPHAGHPRDDLRPGLRVRHYRSVTLGYFIEDNEVLIHRVVHHSRDYERVLKRR